ncbi:hypothetical protein QBC35DRAFT_530505 [Podospora australis]|uniref:Rhodopsin domain-containing protein n=1 Tax=Podospora australis TaxID=1536484 RepID=A0AAN6WX93_9PEZI|nr:hypothetical protein QBC35DRAFT_530505 [Podospora australis]
MATPDLSNGPVLLSVSLATATFAFATTFVRFYVRLNNTPRSLAADDYTSLGAAIVALIGTIFGIIESTSSTPSRALEYDVLGQPWYLMSVTLSKISICLFFFSVSRQWRILLGVLVFSLAAVNFSFALAVNLQCRPLEKVWRPETEGVCWDGGVMGGFGVFQGAFSVFTWFFLASFPGLMVRYSPRREDQGEGRWVYWVSAGLSFASGIFAIVRTAETSKTSLNSVYSLRHFHVSLMANLEQNLGLISANTLTFGALFSRFASSTSSSPNRGRRDPYSSYSSQNSRRSAKRKQPSRAGSSASLHPGSGTPSVQTGGSKRSSRLIILQRHSGYSYEDDNAVDYLSDEGEEDMDLEAWPRGIIKTVSVEVVEEVNPDHVFPVLTTGEESSTAAKPKRASMIAIPSNAHIQRSGSGREGGGFGEGGRDGGRGRRISGSGGEMDWERVLRAGPPR